MLILFLYYYDLLFLFELSGVVFFFFGIVKIGEGGWVWEIVGGFGEFFVYVVDFIVYFLYEVFVVGDFCWGEVEVGGVGFDCVDGGEEVG